MTEQLLTTHRNLYVGTHEVLFAKAPLTSLSDIVGSPSSNARGKSSPVMWVYLPLGGWLCGNWPQRNRARELKLSTERKPDETSDESNYEGPPTACRRNFTSGQPCLKFGEIILITKPLLGLIPHQKLKGRFA